MKNTLTCSHLNLHAPMWQHPDPHGMEALVGIVLQQTERERVVHRQKEEMGGGERRCVPEREYPMQDIQVSFT